MDDIGSSSCSNSSNDSDRKTAYRQLTQATAELLEEGFRQEAETEGQQERIGKGKQEGKDKGKGKGKEEGRRPGFVPRRQNRN